MRIPKAAFLAVVAPWLLAESLAQTLPLEIRPESTRFNLQSVRGVPLSSTNQVPPGSDGTAPTLEDQEAERLTLNSPSAGQFQGWMGFSGVVAPRTPQWLNPSLSLAGNATNLDLPRIEVGGDPAAVLLSARVGAAFVSQQISFLFGSEVRPPPTDENGQLLPETSGLGYWLPEPFSTNNHANAGYYWSSNASTVFAIQSGPLSITWRKRQPTASEPEDYGANPQKYFVDGGNYYRLHTGSYYVSGSPSKPPRQMFWTLGVYNGIGQPVVVPSARVSAVIFVYNNNFPEHVEHEFQAPGQSNLATTNRYEETRTVWYDSQQGSIQAYNHEGRVFMELLGDLKPDGVTRRHLGYEIVDVRRQARPEDVTIDLGDRATAWQDARDDSHLNPSPLLQMVASPLIYRHVVNGSDRIEYYAAQETKNLNDLLVYWLEAGVQGIRWPYRYVRYRLQWPVDAAKYSHYIRPPVTSEAEAKLTSVPLPTDNVPFIQYQDPFDRPRAKLSETYAFYTALDSSVPVHRALLRFNSGDNIAFERVMSWLDVNLRTSSFRGTVATNLAAWDRDARVFNWSNAFTAPRVETVTVSVGQRLSAPAGELGDLPGDSYWTGYIRQTEGTAFNVHAYIDPFAAGFEAANAGSIIPVNANPGDDILEVWWFRRNGAVASRGFKPVYWPSIMSRYQIHWPLAPREIVLASNDGSGPLSSLEAKGSLYYQNDPEAPGYNPNEEHALLSGGQVFALRDDLNLTETAPYSSAPFALIEYQAADGRPSMTVFKVLREKPADGILFDYISEAGRILQPPMPLPLLQAPLEGTGEAQVNYNHEPDAEDGDLPVGWNEATDPDDVYSLYSKFTYRDRKNSFWVYRGLHAGLPELVAGTWNATSGQIEVPQAATAITGTDFSYALHASRRADSLRVEAAAGATLPTWLSISGLVLSGRPQAADEGAVTVRLRVTDVGDDSAVNLEIPITVAATGEVAGQGQLEITSHNDYAAADVTYIGRPPYLADSPTPTNSFTMRFYYKTLEGFAWPGISDPPDVGSIVPYLRPKDADGHYIGDPASKDTASLDIVYRPVWPANPPRLALGDTLTVPKAGLPAVRGQSSMNLLYQQSIAADLDAEDWSVVLHDATREKTSDLEEAGLETLPEGIRTDEYLGRKFFPNLPPHLVDRVYFDSGRGTKGQLVLRGEFKDEPVGEKYLLLNVLRGSDLNLVKGLCPDGDEKKADWVKLVTALQTSVETFHENPDRPGTYIPDDDLTEDIGVDALAEISSDNTAVDSYALSSTGPGTGFVTLIAGNGQAFTPASEPVSMYVIRVTPTLHPGEIKVIAAPNPLNELLTLQHSVDVAGLYDDFEYDWRIAPPVDGLPPLITADMAGWTPLTNGLGASFYTLGGAGIQVLIDNYVVMRYRAKDPAHPLLDQWSSWTDPQLAEGWIKRVLAGINPFNQRVTDLFNNQINTDVSLLTQAGQRWEGDVALNQQTINDYGLIEIYETVLRRGKMLSIDSGINFGPANDALKLAAGYLNDLYVMLGNEAWADAANPTIGIGTKDRTYGDVATSLFSFQGQMATLLDEELALLRGRDDFLQPGVETSPVYNRLYWNYTRGIAAGEVIYSLNYNVQPDPNGGGNGAITANDARRMYPQGHGDAYGHYLTALMNYFNLVLNPSFDWVPRSEAVLVLGKPVQVNYMDERKFASSAAALARAGQQVFGLTWRKDYVADAGKGWDSFSETRENTQRTVPSKRHWGLDHWAVRTGSGAYLNWVVGNAILPEVDADPTHEGIQKVDRTTVPELGELPLIASAVQTSLDSAEARLNPLGLSPKSVPFDLDPQALVGPQNLSHFEQIYERAKMTLRNAVAAFDDAKGVTQSMRSEEDSLSDFQANVARQELAYTNALIEVYGTPYPEDVGPGKTYVTGYAGPDLVHPVYVDNVELSFPDLLDPTEGNDFKIDIQSFPESWVAGSSTDFNFLVNAGSPGYSNGVHYLEFHLDSHGFFSKPETWSSVRSSPGKIQQAISDLILAHNRLTVALDDAQGGKEDLDAAITLFNNMVDTHNQVAQLEIDKAILEQTQSSIAFVGTIVTAVEEAAEEARKELGEALKEALPTSMIVGLAAGGDLTSIARSAVKNTSAFAGILAKAAQVAQFLATEGFSFATETAIRWIDLDQIAPLEWNQELRGSVMELRDALNTIQGQLFTINHRLQEFDEARRRYRKVIADGQRIQQERLAFRQRAAAVIQGFRTRDAAFRVFRNEKLERYKTLFDLAAEYAFLAAQAYDYETGLLHTDTGRKYISRIINSRALGVVKDGEPQYAGSSNGDPGLSSALAEMHADWLVLKGRLGINNPDDYGTTVSLRTENFRILSGSESDLNWRDVLQQGRRANLLEDDDVRRHCMQIDPGDGSAVPGIVVEFSTVIANGLNLFGKPLAAGDHAYSPSSFATKIYAAGVAFKGYIGMDNPTANGSAVGGAGGSSPSDPTVTYLDPLALAATPYVYLIPVGVDSMRSPPLGDSSVVRTWSVDDVTVPLPFNISASDLSTKRLYQSGDSLTDQLFGIRKHQAFRPVSDAALLSENIYGGVGGLLPSPYTNSRLIGRTVWNSRWKLVIPGQALLSNPNEGLDRFVQTVTDIKLHFRTYSYSGN